MIDAIQAGRDVMGDDGPLQLTRSELRTIQHNLGDMHGRHASTAKHLLLRLTDAMAGKPQSLIAAGQHDGGARAAQEAQLRQRVAQVAS